MRILFATAYMPYPPDSGGRVRSYHLLRWVAERHTVDLVAFWHDPADLASVPALQRLCTSVRTMPAPAYPLGPLARLRRALLAPADLVMPRRSAQMAAALANSPPFDLAILDDLGAAEYACLLEGAPTILSKHNVEASLYRQLARAKRPLSPAWALAHLEALALERYEEGLKDFNDLITKDQRNKQAWLGVAKGLYGMKRNQDALKCVRKALTLDPKYQAAVDFEKTVLTGAPAVTTKDDEGEADWEEVKE